MWMNALTGHMTVTQTPHVQILMDHLNVIVILVTLEMGVHVLVRVALTLIRMYLER